MSNQKGIFFWIFIFIVLAGCLFVKAELEPLPINDKPVLTKNIHEWYMYGNLISREHKVIFPDGSTSWIKSTTKITPTDKQWQDKADAMWSMKEQEPKPQICPHCGQEYWP